MQDTEPTSIRDLLSADRIHLRLPCASKEDVINIMVDMLDGHPSVRDLEDVRQAVFEREELMSTGVGKELALPHAKTASVSGPVAVFALTRRPIDFEAMDERPVRIVFLLIGPEEASSLHIKLLSRISRIMNRDEFRERLLSASSEEEVLDTFEEAESQLQAEQ